MADKNENPFELKSCYNCSNLKGYVNLWCGDEQAAKFRGTRIPGCIHCKFWKPDWDYISDEYKKPENGWTEPPKKYSLSVNISSFLVLFIGVLFLILIIIHIIKTI